MPLACGRHQGVLPYLSSPVDLGTKLQEQSHDVDVIAIGCLEQRTPKIDVRASFQNEPCRVEIGALSTMCSAPRRARGHQHGVAKVPPGVNIGSVSNERNRYLEVAFITRLMQRRPARI